MQFPTTPAQWAHFLGALGVPPVTAAVWCEAFAAECVPERFSKGASELDDYIAEALHETNMLRATVEDLHYSPARIRELGRLYGEGSRWARAAREADVLAGNPEALAEALYGGRFGNTRPGDGFLYRGRGIPMVTFHDNYARLGDLTGLPLADEPERLEDPATAVRVSVLWWEDKIPDALLDNQDRIRVKVQGSSLGLDHTRKLAALARANLPPEAA